MATQQRLNPADFKHYVDAFNAADTEDIVNLIPNAAAWDWMAQNVPLFTCPDKEIERIYYYRWWTFRKHIKQTPAGTITFVVQNTGQAPHNFAIKGNGVEERLPVLEPGQSATLTVDLSPGTYEYECTVPGHAMAGMQGTLTVT